MKVGLTDFNNKCKNPLKWILLIIYEIDFNLNHIEKWTDSVNNII